jgi:PadR family transcriptional regulator PadR
MDTNTTSNEYVRGTLKTIVLNLLAEQKRMYGYELEQDGFLLTESVEVDGRLRKYYSLTTPGSEAARIKTDDLERFVDAIRLLLAPKIISAE